MKSIKHTLEKFASNENVEKLSNYMFQHWVKPPIFEESKEFFEISPLPIYIVSNIDITIDLSPQTGNIWGDYARTIIVENGKVVEDIELIKNMEWKSGLQMEEKLHAELLRFATKETTFEDSYYHMNEYIVENGFVNLDFMGNLGHSIVKSKGDRVYIEKENVMKLGDVKYFTFEPHIAFPDSKYGCKKENIYYFDEAGLVEL